MSVDADTHWNIFEQQAVTFFAFAQSLFGQLAFGNFDLRGVVEQGVIISDCKLRGQGLGQG